MRRFLPHLISYGEIIDGKMVPMSGKVMEVP